MTDKQRQISKYTNEETQTIIDKETGHNETEKNRKWEIFRQRNIDRQAN